HRAFTKGAAALEQRWDVMLSQGVPEASLAPLRASLGHSDYQAGWWAPVWWTQTGKPALDQLQHRSDAAWTAALAAARLKAQAPQTGWEQLMITEAQYVPTDAVKDLLSAMQTLRTLISLNNNVAAGLRPLMLLVDQAAAEQTTNGRSFLSQFNDIKQRLHDASLSAQLSAVGQSIATLQTAVQTELTTDQCGHSVGSGKVITLNLTLQEMIFYQDGCAVNAAPTTTGRQYLRTPAGNFHVFYKASPFTMVSPWPP